MYKKRVIQFCFKYQFLDSDKREFATQTYLNIKIIIQNMQKI